MGWFSRGTGFKEIARVLSFLILSFWSASEGHARFSSRFSLSVGEEYNDNIFFSKRKEHDFVTTITPTLSFFYTLPVELTPVFTLNLAPSGQIFARHSDLNNFGFDQNFTASTGYTYRYSPRLSFHLSDSLSQLGSTRTTGVAGQDVLQGVRTPTTLPPQGGIDPRPLSQRSGDLISSGKTLTNLFSLQGTYLYAPDITFTGGYSTVFATFLDEGGRDVSHSIGVRGVYNWRQAHNIHAGYTMSIISARNGDDSVVHNFDVGDDYFSTYTIRLTPTLTVAASTGIGFNAGSSGPRVVNNTNITVQQLWERATLAAGVQKGLTASYGISGPSDTTSFFTSFIIRLTERLTGTAGVDYSLFDTDDVNFNTFQTHAGLQYWMTSWLSSNLRYSYRWIDSGAGATSTDLLERGKVSGNSVNLTFTAHFDLWPNFGLSRGITSPYLTPVITRQVPPPVVTPSPFPPPFVTPTPSPSP
ncbi:MAG: hypothetical protein HY695_19585 [Deltaproteobacteria bacterium]|nr:hypothetical protein [Deltaproteobacteria bacterium]